MFLLCPLNVLLTELHLLPKQNVPGKLFPIASTLQEHHLYPDTSAKSIREDSPQGRYRIRLDTKLSAQRNFFTPEGQEVGSKGRAEAAKATEAEASAASKQEWHFCEFLRGKGGGVCSRVS